MRVRCPLLTLHSLPGGSRWCWADALPSRPSADALSACGFGGAQWCEPAAETASRNLLLLLHGLGDGPTAFARLGRQMALPQTTALALLAPLPLPAGLEGAAWHQSFTPEGHPVAAAEAMSSLARDCRPRLLALLALLEAHGWPARRIFLFGFAQGGVAAVDLALHTPFRLGGAVSVCGHLPEAPRAKAPPGEPPRRPLQQTPVLVVAGADDAQTPLREAQRRMAALQRDLPAAKLVALPDMGLRMVGSEREMRPVMTFFSETLELSSEGLEADPSLVRLDRVGPGGELHVSSLETHTESLTRSKN